MICCSSVVYYLSVTSARWFITSPCFPEGFLLAPLARWLSLPYCAGGLFFPPPGGLFLLLQLVNLTLLLLGDLFLPHCQVVVFSFLPLPGGWLIPSSHCQVIGLFLLPLPGGWLIPSSHCQVAYSFILLLVAYSFLILSDVFSSSCCQGFIHSA